MTNSQALKAAARAIEPWMSAEDIESGEPLELATTCITAYHAALPPLTPELEEMRERLLAPYSHRGDGFATQYFNPDGPDAWALIERLVRPPITEGIVERIAMEMASVARGYADTRGELLFEAADTIQRLTHELSVARGEGE